MKRRGLFLILVALMAVGIPVRSTAQWTETAHKLLGLDGATGGSAISFKDGVLWAGYQSLFTSVDSGVTWKAISPFFKAKDDWIVSIEFLDKAFGLVTTYADAYLTTDGGASWNNLFPDNANNFGGAVSGCFGGSRDTILISLAAPGTLYRSVDRGVSWKTVNVNEYATQLLYRKGSLYYFTQSRVNVANAGGTMFRSSDGGGTWNNSGGSADEDCYSFTHDSCQDILYLVNEAAEKALDVVSQILISSDDGASWNVSLTQPTPYLAGAVAGATNSLYAATLADGVLRSTDRGAKWTHIGGPSSQHDASSLCAIDDNIIIAYDDQGSIWRTTNSGGNRVIPPAFTAPSIETTSLFDGAIASSCTPALATARIHPFSGTLCSPPMIRSQWIDGPDGAYYALSHTSAIGLTDLDSDVVLFQPNGARDYHATLRIQLTDGTEWDVALNGGGRDSENVILQTENIVTDSIGEEIVVKVRAIRSGQTGFDVPIAYDSSVLVYGGTFDDRGAPLDTARLPAGHAIVHVYGSSVLSADSTVVFVHFAFYPTAQNCGAVTFGPGRFSPDTVTCGNIRPSVAQICGTSACGQSLLSEYLRYSKTPVFRVTPNPASARAELTSNVAVEGATVEVLNSLGRTEFRVVADVSSRPVTLDFSGKPAGAKWIRITSPSGVWTTPVMIEN